MPSALLWERVVPRRGLESPAWPASVPARHMQDFLCSFRDLGGAGGAPTSDLDTIRYIQGLSLLPAG